MDKDNTNKKLNICNTFNFYDMVGFSRWLLKSNDMSNTIRYVYIESKDYFISDNGNKYSWEDLYKIYLKNL